MYFKNKDDTIYKMKVNYVSLSSFNFRKNRL
jgi:hypothetical protein